MVEQAFLNRHLRFNIAEVVGLEQRPFFRSMGRQVSCALTVDVCGRTGLAEILDEISALGQLLLFQAEHSANAH